mgnify:FL=1|jgi:hypothetical protein
MKRFNGIVESEFAPSKYDMWLFKGSLKYFGPSGWADIQAAIGGSVDWDDITNKPDFATVATSGSYNDLSDKPTIPPAYTLPAATTSAIGGVRMATNVDNLATGAELATVVTKVNAILSALKVADIMVKDEN